MGVIKEYYERVLREVYTEGGNEGDLNWLMSNTWRFNICISKDIPKRYDVRHKMDIFVENNL